MKTTLAQRLQRWAQVQWPYALTATLLWCAMLPLAGHGHAAPTPAATSLGEWSREWPNEWRGQALQPLARSTVEARFAERFPGRIARFRVMDGGDELVLRDGVLLTETAKGQSWLAERIKQIPLKRAAEPAEIADLILFLASRKNRFMVGEAVLANGGIWMV